MRLEVEANHVRGAACLEACVSASVHFGYLFSHRWGQRRENGVQGIMRLQLGPESGLVRGMPRTRDRTEFCTEDSDRHRDPDGAGTGEEGRKYRMYEYERMQVVSLMTKKTR